MKLSRTPTLLVALLVLVAIAAVGCSFRLDSKIATAIAQSPTLWSQLVTGPGVDVTIQAGDTVLFDVSEGNVRDLTVRGTFQVPDNADARLRVHRNLIIDGGRTIRGSTLQRFVIEWPSVFDPGFVGGGDHLTALPTDPGLWLFRGAQWGLNGDPKRAWMRMLAPIPAGATSFTLPEDPVGWRAGDELLITPTEPVTVSGHFWRHDVRTIASVSGRTITLTQPTQYPHPSITIRGVTFGAEVANLTRNVVLTGRTTGHPHLYAHGLTGPITLENLEIRLFGPRRASPNQGHSGRYSLHFHKNGDASRGSIVRGVVIRESTNMGFVPHASHGILFEDNLVFDCTVAMREGSEGCGLWWDDSPGGTDTSNSTHDTTVRRVGVHQVRRVTGLNSGWQRQNAFSTSEGNGNRYEDVWASGVQAPPGGGGSQLSCMLWPEGSTARRQGIWTIQFAVCHNNQNGVVFWINDDPRSPALPHPVFDLVAYHNSQWGIDFGAYAQSTRMVRPLVAGNGAGALLLHAQGLLNAPELSFEDGYFDGRGRLYAVRTVGHQLASAQVYWRRNHFTGYTRAAIGFHSDNGTSAREWATFEQNTFTGNPFWLQSGINSQSLISVNDSLNGHLQLRRFDQVGEFRPEWNARVTTFAVPSR